MNTPKPGDFPIGSIESRAAMRLQLSNQRQKPCIMEMLSHIPELWQGDGPEPGDWNKVPRLELLPWGDRLMRFLYVPDGMTVDEARKVMGI
jgi:hypothetical protein